MDWVPSIQETNEDKKSPTIDTNTESGVYDDSTVYQSIIARRRSKRCQNNVINTADNATFTGIEGKTNHYHEGAELILDFANSNIVSLISTSSIHFIKHLLIDICVQVFF